MNVQKRGMAETTDKELRRLSRAALIEIVISQIEENAKLEKRIAELQDQISDKTIAVSRAGSLANAALSLNGVFESAESAANQYLDNIRRANLKCNQMIENAKRKADEIIKNAEEEAAAIRGTAPEVKKPEPEPKSDPFADAFSAFLKNNS